MNPRLFGFKQGNELMSECATLVDVNAVPRLIVSLWLDDPLTYIYRLVTIQIADVSYEATQKAWLTESLKSPDSLATLLDNLDGQGEFRVWGLGDYRLERDLLVCEFIGDGRGHFTVAVRFAEGRLRIFDRFVADQTCLRLFLNELALLS